MNRLDAGLRQKPRRSPCVLVAALAFLAAACWLSVAEAASPQASPRGAMVGPVGKVPPKVTPTSLGIFWGNKGGSFGGIVIGPRPGYYPAPRYYPPYIRPYPPPYYYGPRWVPRYYPPPGYLPYWGPGI